MSKIALMCDSSADITEQEAKELDIHVLRMPIVIKDKEYIEGVNNAPRLCYNMGAEREAPRSAAHGGPRRTAACPLLKKSR